MSPLTTAVHPVVPDSPDFQLHSLLTQFRMTSSPLTPKKEKRNLAEFLRTRTRRVKNATTAWKRTSDEPPERISLVSQESGSRHSARSETLPEKPQAENLPVDEFDPDQSWDTYAGRYSEDTDVDWEWNPQEIGAWELAEHYRNLIGKHPFEIELEIELEMKAKELVAREAIERKAREVERAKAVEEAIMEKKRRQWQERKEASERAKRIEEEERGLRAAVAKQKREMEQAAFRKEAARTTEARNRQSNVSAITTWTNFIGSGNKSKLDGKINNSTGLLNARQSPKPTLSPSVSSLARGLASSNSIPPNNGSSKSFSASNSQPSRLTPYRPSESDSNLSDTSRQQDIHEIASLLARKRLDDLHEQYAMENGGPISSNNLSEGTPFAPKLSQQEFTPQTRFPGSGNQTLKSKTLPKVKMVNGRWIEERTGKSLSSGSAGTYGSIFNEASTEQATRHSDPNYAQKSGPGTSPGLTSERPVMKKWSHSSMEVEPLFSDYSRRHYDDNVLPPSHFSRPGPQHGMTAPVDIPTSRTLDRRPSTDFQFPEGRYPPLRPGQSSAPKERAPPIPERSPRRRYPSENQIETDLREHRSRYD